MGLTRLVCTGCSLLCDDIEIDSEGDRIARVENACLKGASFLCSADSARRAPFLVKGKIVSETEAVEWAADLLRKATRVLIFGLDSCTLEAQAAGIDLAQALGAVIDDVSSFSYGAVVEGIMEGEIPSCAFAEVKDADLIIYWGCNPYHSHPRHLSKFSYYAREKYDEAGWRPVVKAISVEVRDTETTSLCYPVFKVEPGGDAGFIGRILTTAKGEDGSEDHRTFVELLRGSQFCVIFMGLGLIYSLDNDLNLFLEMLHQFGRDSRFAVIPMVGHFNMLGFNHSLYERTGHINRVRFGQSIHHGEECSFLEQIRNRLPDCVLIVGSDPFSSQPRSLTANLEGIPIICLDPFLTATTRSAEVVLGTAISGLEVEGKAIRMDGTVVSLPQGRKVETPSDEWVLRQLLTGSGHG